MIPVDRNIVLTESDLMPEDWVFINGEVMRASDVGVHYSFGKPYLAFGCLGNGDIHPVRITPEILVKNGWAECNYEEDGSVQYEYVEEDKIIDWWTPSGGVPGLFGFWNHPDDVSHEVINELPINYVHELQHIMRLCRIRKKIIL